ncbi:cobalamin-dependent protein [bacterium]|nr:cobalamin-dependent protein [candidate division CSSED10-310 bacterium]
MRTLLLQAPLGRREQPIYPLGIATLAACIQDVGPVRLADPNLPESPPVEPVVREFEPDVIGVSIRNIDSQMKRDLVYYYRYLKDYLKGIRSLAPNARIILGGSGFSLFPREIMTGNPGVDAGVILEAENTLRSYLLNPGHPESTPGIYYRHNGRIRFSGNPPFPDLDHLPLPGYDLLDPKPYEPGGGVGIQTKRGCPLTCAYCTYPHLNGRYYRLRPVPEIIRELEELDRYGVHEVTFVDGLFNLPRDRTVEILEAVRARGIKLKWRGWFTEIGFDSGFAELCRQTGCSEFSFSPDGFSRNTLKALGKSIVPEDIHNVLETARSVPGIRVAFNFFWNPPDQTLGTFVRMLWFTVKCRLFKGKNVGGIIFGNPRIEPHTPLWQRAVDDGIIDPSTCLLPETTRELRTLFYSNPSTRYLDMLFNVYSGLWKLKNRMRGQKRGENSAK